MSVRVNFSLGNVYATPGALEAFATSNEQYLDYLARHSKGDWGNLCAEDKAANNRALIDGTRLLSAYELNCGVTVWIITEWDRSVTTALLPEEY